MDAGDIAAFVAAGASIGALGTSLWTARYTSQQTQRLESLKWSRERLADTVQSIVLDVQKQMDFFYVMGDFIREAEPRGGAISEEEREHITKALEGEESLTRSLDERLGAVALVARSELSTAAERLRDTVTDVSLSISEFKEQLEEGLIVSVGVGWDVAHNRQQQTRADFFDAARRELGVN